MASDIEMLEVLVRKPKTDSGKPPLLLVHGAYTGAWCWDIHFMEYLTNAGYPTHAVSLRGHGGSRGHNQLHSFRIRDYVDDVRAVALSLENPILIGHSMGGFVVQKYLELYSAPAACLMASVPPEGLMYSAMQLAFDDPLLYHQMNMMQTMGRWTAHPEILRRALFSPDIPQEDILPFFSLFQDESSLAILDMSWLDLPDPTQIEKIPMMIMGAEGDTFFPRKRVRATAEAYGVEPVIFRDMCHAIMLEPHWKDAAKELVAWLDSLKPDAPGQ